VTQSNISYTIHDPSTYQISDFLDISKQSRTWRMHLLGTFIVHRVNDKKNSGNLQKGDVKMGIVLHYVCRQNITGLNLRLCDALLFAFKMKYKAITLK